LRNKLEAEYDSFEGAGSYGLPSFMECETAMEAGSPTPLERLIFNHEPNTEEEEESFRADLAATIRSCLPNAEE